MADSLRLQLDPTVCHFAADSAADDGTVKIVAYTGASVVRIGFYEDVKGREQYGRYMLRLSLDPKHVNTDRLNSGAAPLLREHEQHVDAVIGQIVAGSVEVTPSGVTARAKLSDAPGDADVVAKIRSGIARNTSVGAFLHSIVPDNLEADPPTFVATSWEPFEVSAVAVGADPGARVELHLITPPAPPAQQEPSTMSTQHAPATFTAEELSTRNKAVRESARLLGLSGDKVDALVDNAALTLDAARSELFAIKADADKAQGIDAGRRIEVGLGETERLGETMALSIAARHQGKTLADGDAYRAREFRHASLPDIAAACLRANGYDTVGMTRVSIIDAALTLRSEAGARAYLSGHATTDFPYVLGDSIRKTMRRGYTMRPGIHTVIARKRALADYRSHKHVMLGDAPDFVETAEGAPTVYGPMTESQGSVALKDFTSGVAVTRQVLINDNLGAFMDLALKFGQKALQRAERKVLGVLTDGTSGDWGDGLALFATGHGNIDATGAAPSLARISAMRLLMRLQTSLAHGSQTAEPVDILPRFLAVPEALLVGTQQLLTGNYMPTSATTAVVPALGGLEIVSSPIFDSASATAYYLLADPNVDDGLEYCVLEGEDGLVTASTLDFDTEGFKVRGRLALAAHCRDYRSVVRNAGA